MERHHAEQQVATRPCDPEQLPKRLIRTIHHVAQWSAVADDRIERSVLIPAEVHDVGQLADFHRRLESGLGHVRDVQLELTGGDVRDDDPRAEARELHREPTRRRADLEYAVARADELREVVPMDVERDPVDRGRLVPPPLLVAVLVVRLRGLVAVVGEVHGRTIRRGRAGQKRSKRIERLTSWIAFVTWMPRGQASVQLKVVRHRNTPVFSDRIFRRSRSPRSRESKMNRWAFTMAAGPTYVSSPQKIGQDVVHAAQRMHFVVSSNLRALLRRLPALLVGLALVVHQERQHRLVALEERVHVDDQVLQDRAARGSARPSPSGPRPAPTPCRPGRSGR